jgi:hypothetical protein
MSVFSNASAVCELLRGGLAAEGFKLAEKGKHSGEFGVTDEPRGKRGG